MDPVEEQGGGSLTRDFGKKMNSGVELKKVLEMGVSLHTGPVGEPAEEVRLQGTVRDSGRRAPEMEHLSLRKLCQGNLEA